jgi:hypothetical protein
MGKHKGEILIRGFQKKTIISFHNEPSIYLKYVGRLVVVIDVNPSHGFWTRRLMKLFGHEGK